MTIMSGFLRGLDAFTAQLLLLERAPEQVDVCEAQAAEAALFGGAEDGEGDPDDDETSDTDETSEPAPAAYH